MRLCSSDKCVTSSRRRDARRGAAAVEFALTLPIIVLLLLGTIEYGNYFSQLAMVNAVARDACRFGGNQDGPAEAGTNAQAAARQLLVDLGFPCQLGSGQCSVQAQPFQESGLTFLELRVDVEYDQLTGAFPEIGLSALPELLRARAVYPVVGD